jgi:hypothetical protein
MNAEHFDWPLQRAEERATGIEQVAGRIGAHALAGR